MSQTPHALTLNDLAVLDGPCVAKRNMDLLHLSRREYHCAGLVLRFGRQDADPTPDQAGDVWLALVHAGQPLRLRISKPWAESLAGSAGLTLHGLDRGKLDLLCLTRLVPHLPSTLQYQAAAFAPTELPEPTEDFVNHGIWCGVHCETDEVSGHQVQIEAAANFPIYGFFASFDRYLRRAKPHRLAQLSLPVPLVAARWTVQASDLVGLEVGDVLLIA